MIREVELNLLVPSSELLVRLASGEMPLGVAAGPPRIRLLRETYFDTPDQALRRRGMTCKLRQGEGEQPSVVVTVGEGPDSEGITSRSRLMASAIGLGVFETLRGESEMAAQIRKVVDPSALKPLIALEIQRLGRALRTRVLRRPVLLLLFDRITVQIGRSSSVFHEIRVRRVGRGGPLIRDIAQGLRDQYHLFPDGLSTLQRAHRILAMEGRTGEEEISPYALNLVLVLFRDGELGLLDRKGLLSIPSFRGSGEDAARALLSDLTGREDLELARLGTTDPRMDQPAMEVWAAPAPASREGETPSPKALLWHPWHLLLEEIGRGALEDPDLLPPLLLLTRRRLCGQMKWIPPHDPSEPSSFPPSDRGGDPGSAGEVPAEILSVELLLPLLRKAEDRRLPLRERLAAVGELSERLEALFLHEVRGLKERILSGETDPARTPPLRLLDLLSVRVRGITDRLYEVVGGELLPGLAREGIQLKSWSGLSKEERRALMEEFHRTYLPAMKVVADWGPAFVPEMPPVGCAMGLLSRAKGSESGRFFHLVLAPSTPSFMKVPGGLGVLPLEEVVRGYFCTTHPGLERADTHLFRFRTAEVTIREVRPAPPVQSDLAASGERKVHPEPASSREGSGRGEPGSTGETFSEDRQARGLEPEPVVTEPGPAVTKPEPVVTEPGPAVTEPEPVVTETRQSVVVRVVVNPSMVEIHQAQLLRALERQISRKSPLIGWSDIYPVPGPMDLSGLPGLLDTDDDPGQS